MSVEVNAKFITELNEAFPRKQDLIKEGDDHLRLIKAVLKNTLPGFDITVNIAADKLNKLDNLTDFTEDTITVKGNVVLSEKKTVDMGGNKITGVGDPTEDTDAVNKKYLLTGGVAAAWPVNSIFMTVDPKNPSELLGFGTWVKYASGRCLIGTGSDKDEYGEAKLIALEARGGTYKEKLTENQGAIHSHGSEGLTFTTNSAGNHTHRVIANGQQASGFYPGAHGATSGGNFATGTLSAESGGSHTHTGVVSGKVANSVGGEGHNNMMPYIGVHIWKRTA